MSWKRLVPYALVTVLMLALGGWLTSIGMQGSWYPDLHKPSFQPPGWVFSPVWITLLALLAVATARVAPKAGSGPALKLYWAQVVLNVGWSALFFALQRPSYALIEIALMFVVLALQTRAYFRLDRAAGWMLVPYLIWLSLASAMNADIVRVEGFSLAW